jgi:hypothetical protein
MDSPIAPGVVRLEAGRTAIGASASAPRWRPRQEFLGVGGLPVEGGERVVVASLTYRVQKISGIFSNQISSAPLHCLTALQSDRRKKFFWGLREKFSGDIHVKP